MIVNEAILGEDFKTVVINGKAYTINPPTIHKIAGAAKCLTKIDDDVVSFRGIVSSLKGVECVSKALSWFIQDNEELAEELSHGTFDENIEALETAYSLISVENFMKLLGLAKNIVSLTAKQKS